MSASNKKKLRKEQATEMMTERQKQERSEAKKTKLLTIGFIAALVLIVGIFLGTQVSSFFKINGVLEKNTIAATVGNHKLNSITMNYFFIDAVEADYSSASSYVQQYSSFGMQASIKDFLPYDPAVALNAQNIINGTQKASDYYWDIAMNNARTVYGMYDLAMANGFTLPTEYANSIEQEMWNFQFQAAISGVDVDTALRNVYGNGANEESYREYQTVKATATAYYQKYQSEKTFTDEERATYFAAHPNDFSVFNYNSYTVNYTNYLPKKEVAEGQTPTYTAEEQAAAREAAKKDAAALSTLTSVADLDAAIATLPYNEGKEGVKSSAINNGSFSSKVEDQKNWFFNAERKEGDSVYFENKTTTPNADGTTTEVVNTYTVYMYGSRYDYTAPKGNVRHILVKFEGGSYDSTTGQTTYSTEEKAAAKAKADAILTEWQNGAKTEDSFIALVSKSEDTASVANGGLYENIGKNSGYETNFENWAIDPARKVGDTGVIETAHGYHVMYYAANGEGIVRDSMIDANLLSEHMPAWEKQVTESISLTPGKNKRIQLDLVVNELFGG